ncbi:MAG: LPXTG cell wall anchor domain-containing protein, partial [bacterium]|nr:LPXTG cell wall anchor domain-containing protein [bacterium]
AAAAPAAPPAAPEGPPAAPAPPVEAAADSSPARTRSWQDAATNDTAVIVLAGVGLVLIAALLVVTRRQRHLVEETSADVADVW